VKQFTIARQGDDLSAPGPRKVSVIFCYITIW
jgi:hypothetical protein